MNSMYDVSAIILKYGHSMSLRATLGGLYLVYF